MFRPAVFTRGMIAYVLAVLVSSLATLMVLQVPQRMLFETPEKLPFLFGVGCAITFVSALPGYLLFLPVFRRLWPRWPVMSIIAGIADALVALQIVIAVLGMNGTTALSGPGFLFISSLQLSVGLGGLTGGLTWWLAATRIFRLIG